MHEFNRYVYAMANPVMFSDPSGLFISYAKIQAKVSTVGSLGVRHMAYATIQGGIAGGLGYAVGITLYNGVLGLLGLDHVPRVGIDWLQVALNIATGMAIDLGSHMAKLHHFKKLQGTFQALQQAAQSSKWWNTWWGFRHVSQAVRAVQGRISAVRMLADLTASYVRIAAFFTGMSGVADALIPDVGNIESVAEYATDFVIQALTGLLLAAPIAGLANSITTLLDFADFGMGSIISNAIPIALGSFSNGMIVGMTTGVTSTFDNAILD